MKKNIINDNNNEMTHGEFFACLFFISILTGFILFVFNYQDLKGKFSIEKSEYQINKYFNTDYFKRVDYLTNNCELIPGLEVLNNGKTSFICKDKRIYLEKIPKYMLFGYDADDE